MRLDDFEVKFETGPVQQGAARDFAAHVTVTAADGTTTQQLLQVNEPLSVGSNNVHLLGHGYAPVVTVTGRLRQRRLLRAGGVPAAGRQLPLRRA